MSQYDYDWEIIKTRWMAGESFFSIAKDEDTPSRQAMAKRAKNDNWQRVTEVDTTTLPVDQNYWHTLNVRQQTVIQELAYGAKDLAEAAIRSGVPKNTVYDWTKAPEYRALCDVARASTRRGLIKRLYDFGERDPKPNQWLLEKLWAHEFGQRPTTTNALNIRIGNLIRRDSEQKMQHIIEHDDGTQEIVELTEAEEIERGIRQKPEQIERKEPAEVEPVVEPEKYESQEPVETVPLVEPVEAQKKPVNWNGVEICPDCKQVPHPGYPHQCLSKRGLPV